jgi:ABC-type transport system substrate-binding protein
MRGKALPQIGLVEVNVIEEELTRVLEFERGNLDYIIVRGEVAQRMLQDDKLKREYAERGVRRVVFPEAYTFYVYFNVADPVLGGMTPERIALRRAISLGIDESSFVKVVYAGQATLANQLVAPGTTGFDPSLPTKARYDPAAANALLDRFGYVKRDAGGFRMTPDGKPLAIRFTLRSLGISREIATLVKKNMDAIGVNFDFHITPFQDTIKELEAGRYQMYFGGYGGYPSGYEQLSQFYAKMSTSVNFTRFKLDAYDQLMVRYLSTPDDRDRVDLAKRMYEITQAYAPVQPVIFRLENDFVQPWVEGFGPMLFDNCWKYLWLK